MVILKIYLGFCLLIIIAAITFIITYYKGTRSKLCDSCRRLTKKYSKWGKNWYSCVEEYSDFCRCPEFCRKYYSKTGQETRALGDWSHDIYRGGEKCSVCEKVSGRPSPFCPNCGADMRGSERTKE